MSYTIVLDPGHGKNANRSPAISSYYEGNRMFDLAYKLKPLLEKSGFKVIVTRKSLDECPELVARGSTAGKNGAAMFLSLHSNAVASSVNESVRGVETFYSLFDTKGKAFATKLNNAIVDVMCTSNRGPKTRKGSGNWDYYTVIKSASESGCKAAFLVEHGFHTSTKDTAWLLDDNNLQKLAETECKVICSWFGVTYGGGTPTTTPTTSTSVKVNDTVTIKSGAVYGGLAVTRGNTVPATIISRGNFTVSKVQTNCGVEEALLKEITSWVATGSLTVVKSGSPTPATPATPTTLYRVRSRWTDATSQIGAFSNLDNAKKLVDENPTYSVFDEAGNCVYNITPATTVKQLYRVRLTADDAKTQKGAFSVYANAVACADDNIGYSVFDENFKCMYTSVELQVADQTPEDIVVPSTPTPTSVQGLYGTDTHEIASYATNTEEDKAKAKQIILKNNAAFDVNIVEAVFAIAPKYGIEPLMVISQSILETGWYKFIGSSVKLEQHNYCGLGATGGGVSGASFDTIEQGIHAQCQHLFAYGCADNVPEDIEIVDPRFKYVTRGVAPTWEELAGRWAVPGYPSTYKSIEEAAANKGTYGQKIRAIYDLILSEVLDDTVPSSNEPIANTTPDTTPDTEPAPDVITEPTIDTADTQSESILAKLFKLLIEIIKKLLHK